MNKKQIDLKYRKILIFSLITTGLVTLFFWQGIFVWGFVTALVMALLLTIYENH